MITNVDVVGVPFNNKDVLSSLTMQIGALAHTAVNVSVQVPMTPPPTVTLPAESFPTIDGEVPHELTDGAAPDVIILFKYALSHGEPVAPKLLG